MSTVWAALAIGLPLLARAENACRLEAVYTFNSTKWGNDVWISSLALRPNGSVLMTSPTNNPGALFQYNPYDVSDPIPVVRNFPGVNATHGVVSTYPDMFYVIGNSMSMNTTDGTWSAVPNSNKLFSVDFENLHPDMSPTVREVMTINATFALTSLAKFMVQNSTLITSDAKTGKVYQISIEKKKAKVVIQDEPLMQYPYNTTGDGLARIKDDKHHASETLPFKPAMSKISYYYRHRMGQTHRYLFFTNAAARTFNRIALKPYTDEVKADGNASTIATAGNFTARDTDLMTKLNWDGFAMFPPVGDHLRYRAVLASPQSDELQVVDRDGKGIATLGNLSSPTAATIGKHGKNRELLYVAGGGAKAKWMSCKISEGENCEGGWDGRAGEDIKIYAMDAGRSKCWPESHRIG